jgi:DNA-binding response OmpR family regulator
VILDLKLPDEDGLAIARRLRESLDIPIIILTGRKEEADRVMGLELGADDYVTKPFSQRELMARIKAVLRRTEGKRASRRENTVRAYLFSGWELNTGTRRLKAPDGKFVELTNSEYALLVAFLRAPQKILSRDQLLESSRLHDDIYDRSIDVQILRLRRKVEESPNQPKLIRTERGSGYYLDSPVENSLRWRRCRPAGLSTGSSRASCVWLAIGLAGIAALRNFASSRGSSFPFRASQHSLARSRSGRSPAAAQSTVSCNRPAGLPFHLRLDALSPSSRAPGARERGHLDLCRRLFPRRLKARRPG